jgi:hypothetical protein
MSPLTVRMSIFLRAAQHCDGKTACICLEAAGLAELS